jgi:serine protease Do
LAFVALSLFGLLLMRGLSGEDSVSHEEQVAAGLVMTKDSRATASEFSAAFEAISAQYLPVVVTLHLHPFVGAPIFPQALYQGQPEASRESFSASSARTGRDAALGCGVLVSNDGYILTNNHILPGRFARGDSVAVLRHKGRQVTGLVIGRDPLTDLAVIKIPAKGLPHAKFGDSDRLRVGQWVMAMGQAGSSSRALTAGLVCAKGRSKAILPQRDDLIQIDVPLDESHAGAALVDLEGNLAGISTTFFAGPGGAAIPGNLVRRVMQSLINDGKVTRGAVGATAQDLDHALAKALHLSSLLGALLVDVAANSPAERAGLRRGDVVLQFAGTVIDDAKTLENAVAAQTPGKAVQTVVWRDSVKIAYDVVPEERPDMQTAAPTAMAPVKPAANKLGIHVQNLAGQLARQSKQPGVVVSQIEPNSQAAPILAAGDVIHEINHKTINTVREYRAALQAMAAGETALLLVSRGEKKFFAAVEAR